MSMDIKEVVLTKEQYESIGAKLKELEEIREARVITITYNKSYYGDSGTYINTYSKDETVLKIKNLILQETIYQEKINKLKEDLEDANYSLNILENTSFKYSLGKFLSIVVSVSLLIWVMVK